MNIFNQVFQCLQYHKRARNGDDEVFLKNEVIKKEQQESYENAKICYIYKDKVEYKNVKDK